MTPPGFAVVGTGHSGTGYVAGLLNRNGLTVGHESWWSNGRANQIHGLDGDVSWLALPDIESGVWEGPVAHVTRHPVGCVRSLSMFFANVDAPFGMFAREHQPLPEDPIEAAVEWWCVWNDRCAEVARATIPVEQLRTTEACEVLGKAIRRSVVPVNALSTTVNKHQSQDVPEEQIRELLAGRAERYGYQV